MKTLYFDCFSGISGDMVIGALIDAGADPHFLLEELKKLPLQDEYELQWKKVVKNGITSTKFDVLLKDQPHPIHTHEVDGQTHDHTDDVQKGHSHAHTHHLEHNSNHDHDHEPSQVEHSHSHPHHHEHSLTHENGHHHDHTHPHQHRSYKKIVKLIEDAGFSEDVTETALTIFQKIGEAEGHIHGVPLNDVHFHEVGAVDSIIDIVGTALLIHHLEVKIVAASPIPVGGGRIRIDHGVYPVPAPATLEILKGIPIEQSDLKSELTTPTGAAIVAVLAEKFGPVPSFTVQSVGYGAGTKTFPDHPNVLRVIIGS